MAAEELIEETRAKIGQGSMQLMDAVNEEVLEAVGECIESGRKVMRVMHDAGATRDQIASILTSGAARLAYLELDDDD